MSPSNYIIDVKDLVKSYASKVVVDKVSLQIEKGHIYGFLGPNGSGKTTTIRMICGLLTPDGGSGTCLGYDILRDTRKIKEHVGYMTQAFSLYGDLSVRENLDFVARMFGLNKRYERVQASLDALGISNARSKQLASMLSGGWKQRLALAAATIHNPQVLLLDEPTAGVDPKARREFWDEIHRLSACGVTTLVSTHYMDEAERCHKLAYLAYGKLLADGTITEVIASASFVTYEITGKALPVLAEKLRELPVIISVASFGEVLHISAHLQENFLEVILPFQTPDQIWKKVSPTLEDVFIYLMRNTKDNFE